MLRERGIAFDQEPQLAKMPDDELGMAFFKGPDGNQLAVMEDRR
jgi:hypothetical protein